MYNADPRPLSVISEEIENSLVDMYLTEQERRKKLSKDKEDCYARYREANTGDRSENAPLEEAIRNMKEVNVSIRSCENKISRLRNIEDLSFREKIHDEESEGYKGLRRYNSTGIVSIYSTIRVLKEGVNGEQEEEFIFRIYPDNISNPDIGVIAANTSLAIACLGKRTGGIAIVSSGSSYVKYLIKDVY